MHGSDWVFFCTNTTVALEVMLNLSSLDMFLQVEAGASAVRLKAQGNWAVPHRRRGHSSICDDVVGGCAVLVQ